MTMLTLEAQKHFNDWLYMKLLTDGKFMDNRDFFELPFYLQWGAYVEFFDAFEITCSAYRRVHNSPKEVVYYESNVNGYLGAWSTLEEAQKEAVYDANNFFNIGKL